MQNKNNQISRTPVAFKHASRRAASPDGYASLKPLSELIQEKERAIEENMRTATVREGIDMTVIDEIKRRRLEERTRQ